MTDAEFAYTMFSILGLWVVVLALMFWDSSRK